MSKKNEKNRRKHQQRRIQNDNHQRSLAAVKKFKESTRRILEILEIPDLFKVLPRKYATFYHETRFGSARFLPEEGKKIPHRVFTRICWYLSTNLKNFTVPLGKSEITAEEFVTAGFTLYCLAQVLLEKKHTMSAQAKMMLRKIMENIQLNGSDQARVLWEVSYAVEAVFSRINGTKYYTTSCFSDLSTKNTRSYVIVIHPVKTVVKDIVLDGISRPSYRVGRPNVNEGILWEQLTAREMGLNLPDPDKPLDVYIQSHALIRFRERIDTLETSFLHASLAFSLEDKEIVNYSKGTILLVYKYDKIKLGYFLLEVVDEVVVMKTFLFITNSGTPEGDKLDVELKIGKLEKQFVGIDKLSTFVNSDIMKDERVRNILIKVGLGHLGELDKAEFDYELSEKKGIAADFAKYMKIDYEGY